MINISKKNLNLLICPDCKEKLEKIELREVTIGLCCPKCEIIYPIKDDIPIILAKEARNYDLEYPLLKEIGKKLSNSSFAEFNYVKKTLDLIISKKDALSWEWEDERFWSREYSRQNRNKISKNWNDRIWQRESLVKELTNRLS